MSVQLAVAVAWSFHGTPYIWGGDDPTGFDCSGLVIEILQSVGKLPRVGDWTANDLWLKYRDTQTNHQSPGCLAFWFRDGRATHVEFCIDPVHAIDASGGGSATLTPCDAATQNAFVKVRPVRPGAIICDPFGVDTAP